MRKRRQKLIGSMRPPTPLPQVIAAPPRLHQPGAKLAVQPFRLDVASAVPLLPAHMGR